MIDIVSKELIKPSSPTPQSLKRLNFSMLDHLLPANYVPMAFYYPAVVAAGDPGGASPEIVSVKRLKTSLSQVLTKFYPLAGRIINGNDWIDCNDQGALFVVATASCSLSSLLVKGSEAEAARQVLPIGLETNEPGCPLIVQVTSFPCGGRAIGVRVCHKICDASSRTTFINAWAAVSHGDSPVTAPEFVSAILFPPPPPPPSLRGCINDGQPLTIKPTSPLLELKRDQSPITKKYVFNASSILSLKAKAASEQVPKPTRVEAVTALIWKCAIKAQRISHHNNNNNRACGLSVMAQAVNLRKRLNPPLSDSTMGNIFLCYAPCYQNSNATNNNNEVPDLQGLVATLRGGLTQLREKYIEKIRKGGEEASRAMAECFGEIEEITGREGAEMYRFSSWCGFPIYGADFGSGTPACVGIASSPYKNVGVLMDTNDGCGVEAWVCLSAQDMESFDNDAELLGSVSL